MSTIPPTATPTIPCPTINAIRHNKTVLENEILRLEQEIARAHRQSAPWEEYIGYLADLEICKSLMTNLKGYI